MFISGKICQTISIPDSHTILSTYCPRTKGTDRAGDEGVALCLGTVG
jgi:hypothetical protein